MTITSELLSLPGSVPDGVNTIAAVVGDTVSLALPSTLSAQTTTLARKPAGSSATIASNAFTADVSGYYTLTVAVAAVSTTRTITVVAFPASVLTQKLRPTDPNSPVVNRSVLQNVSVDQRVTLANITAAMEGGATFTLSALFGGAFVGWGSFG